MLWRITKAFLVAIALLVPGKTFAYGADLPAFPPGSTLTQVRPNQVHCGATYNGVDVEIWTTGEQCKAWFEKIKAEREKIAKSTGDDARNSAGMPLHCNTWALLNDVHSNLPNLLDLGPNAAKIAKVTSLMDSPLQMTYPSINGSPARYSLFCQVRVDFSNGLVKFGAFTETQDEYGQVLVRFGG